MTTTASATNTSSSSSSSANKSSRITLNANFDTFLKMLTTQLQYQDPTSPMDTAQFTNQLVMYSQVEQQLSTNDKLDELLSVQKGQGTNTALNYLGWVVSSENSNLPLVNKGASFSVTTDTAPSKIAISITDSTGKIVRGLSMDGTSGKTAYNYTWDGKDGNGNQLADGAYKITVTASDASGAKITSHTYTGGIVTGISTDSSGNALLEIGDVKIKPEDVYTVHAPVVATDSDSSTNTSS